jgi:adenylate kinase family enzyme
MDTFPYRRICVVGTTGSGKSTMAEALAQRLHIPHVELDAIHWEPGWKEADRESTRARVRVISLNDSWVIDGNYGFLRDILWPRAEALVWLDYPLPLIFWRLWWRTWKRVLTKEVLWGTNTERLSEQFFSKDSLFLWALKTQGKQRKLYATLPNLPEFRHIRVFRVRTLKQSEEFLCSLPDTSNNTAETITMRGSEDHASQPEKIDF